ncbi:hypothetical protein M1116_02960 [Patescibacteria group bacterium]|nr:hypothetical protein [Patescibacteria group bacterium]
MKNYNVDSIKQLLSTAKTALVVIPQMNIDAAGAALALALALKKANIDTSVYSPHKTDANYSKLSGLELITDSLPSSDLTISLEYPLDQIEKVSYNDNGGRLNLVVQTKTQAPKIQNNQIMIQSGGSAADISFILGDESGLGQNSAIVEHGNWIFVTPANVSKAWAKATLLDPDAPFSEIFTFLLPMLGLEIDPDSGKDLLIGLRVATQSFSVNVSPESFEAGAICLRATQPAPQGAPAPTPIESVETAPQSKFQPGTNKPNPNPTA